MKELDASTSDVSELEDKLTTAHRRIQKQEEAQEEAESARAQQGQQLTALAQDIAALQNALERVKQDRQQVTILQNLLHLCQTRLPSQCRCYLHCLSVQRYHCAAHSAW